MDVQKTAHTHFSFLPARLLCGFLIAVSTVQLPHSFSSLFLCYICHPFCGYLLSIRYRFLTSIYDMLVNVVAFGSSSVSLE